MIGGITGGIGSALNGGSLGDVLKGAMIGGIQGAIAGGILHGMEANAVKWMDKAMHIAGHGVLGGAANVAMGGKFQDGFLSAAASAYAGWTVMKNTTIANTIGSTGAGQTAIAGIVGGTASVLGGGKFANGAYTGAFQHMLNFEMNTIPQAIGQAFNGVINFFTNFFSNIANLWASPVNLNTASPWMRIAEGELGMSETSNKNRVLEYHSTTRENLSRVDNEGPWCSSFANWVMEQSGIQGTNSAASQSWLGWGQTLDRPAYGAIAISSSGNGKGHVGFIAGRNSKGNLIMLGGNQSDSVRYSRNMNTLQFRFANGYRPNYDLPIINTSGPALNFASTR